jgi:DNA-binding CsgD family transcriptional regulator
MHNCGAVHVYYQPRNCDSRRGLSYGWIFLRGAWQLGIAGDCLCRLHRHLRRNLLLRAADNPGIGNRTAVGAIRNLCTRDAARAWLGIRRDNSRDDHRNHHPLMYPINDWARLTRAEFRIACLVAAGMDAPRVAAELGICWGSAKNRIARICRKLGVRGRVELAMLAWKG